MNITGLYKLEQNPKNLFTLFAGPCVIENEEITRRTAEELCELSSKYSLPFAFKSSYKKANRSRIDSFTGIGDEKGLEILQKIREDFDVPVLTDIHSPEEAHLAASYNIDILQIPAFLCRQTELLVAAGETGKIINIKKGQFLAPSSMKFCADKVASTNNKNIILTDRGTQFGYGDLIIDYRGIPVMQAFGYPVFLDATHSLQQPNTASGVTGGKPEMISTVCRAGIAIGVDGLFIETHPDPSVAKSDGANMLKLDKMEALIKSLIPIRKAII
ncbi:MAG: 3-deoxy-8-phosphooctulonate synthase [Bacteroidales bacterium]